MMKKILLLSTALLTILLSASLSRAQDLPSLAGDSRISHGVLADEVEYYIVSNPSYKGFADLSIVWRLGKPAAADSLSAGAAMQASLSMSEALGFARDCLAGTELFSSPGPERFMRRNGIQGASYGYVHARDNAVIFRFSDINLAKSASVTDSLFLMAFDIVRSYSRFVKDSGAEDCGQAVIISGDIDQNSILEKFRMLSLFVPSIGAKTPESSYKWYPGDSISFVSVVRPGSKIATVTAEYSTERVPEAYMNTVLPVVASQMGEELGMILKRRLAVNLRQSGVPVAGIDYGFTGSEEWGGDETYTLSVRTFPENVREVIPAVSCVLSQMAEEGAQVEEYSQVRKVVGRQFDSEASAPVVSNSSYVERCLASFLYGASLASPAEKYKFFEASGLSDSSGLRFFNRFTSSLISRTRNMTLVSVSDTTAPSLGEMKALFSGAWGTASGSGQKYFTDLDDTTRFDVSPSKCRIRRTRAEAMSGGQFWEFSNGMKVVYKKMPTEGEFQYCLLLHGGFSSAWDAEPGQGAFFSDMLDLYNVRGMAPEAFDDLLSTMGITMDRRVNATDMRISGRAPSGSFWFLMKALVGMTTDCVADTSAFGYYMECEKQRLAARSGLLDDRLVAIDKIMCPGYSFSTLKSADRLTPDLQGVADGYFRRQFAKMNDGVLVILGDLDEFELKKTLPGYIGNFTTGKRIVPRAYQKLQTVSGESTYMVNGDTRSLDVAMSAPLQLSVLEYMSAEIAMLALRDTVMSSISGMAACTGVSGQFFVAPSEKLGLLISVESADTSGFSSGTSVFKPVRTLFAVRSILKDLSTRNISQAQLDMYKTTLKNAITSTQSDPSYWMYMLPLRYSNGKDLHTGWSEKIDEVTADMVREVIASLDGGGKVEYIVTPDRRAGGTAPEQEYYLDN